MGTFLYMAGGFPLPFLLTGILGLAMGAAQHLAIPWEHDLKNRRETEVKKDDKLTLSRAARRPAILFPMLDYVCVEVNNANKK